MSDRRRFLKTSLAGAGVLVGGPRRLLALEGVEL